MRVASPDAEDDALLPEPPVSNPPPEAPVSHPSPRSRFSPVWIIPVVSALLGVWLIAVTGVGSSPALSARMVEDATKSANMITPRFI